MPKIPEIVLAKRLYFASGEHKYRSRPAVRVALAAMIVGVMVMILTLCIVVGFKQTITDKIAGFDAHMQVVNFETNDSYDLQPILVTEELIADLEQCKHVTSVAPFISKPGILKTDSAFHGMVLKGTDYWPFFQENLVSGTLPQSPQEVLLSTDVAQQLQLQTGDVVLGHFVEGNDVRTRTLRISGLYSSGFAQYDDLYVLTTLETMRSFLKKEERDHHYSGIDIRVDELSHLEAAYEAVFEEVSYEPYDENGIKHFYFVKQIYEKNPKIFMWLDLFDMNVIIIIVLMLLVSGFSIVSGLIIMILESVQFIGTMKALGANNGFIRRIFMIQASLLIGKGLLWGNIIGFGLAVLQYFGHVIPLEAATYYVNTVPISFPWEWLVMMNAVTVCLSLTILLLPSMIISKISPAKVMHFE